MNVYLQIIGWDSSEMLFWWVLLADSVNKRNMSWSFPIFFSINCVGRTKQYQNCCWCLWNPTQKSKTCRLSICSFHAVVMKQYSHSEEFCHLLQLSQGIMNYKETNAKILTVLWGLNWLVLYSLLGIEYCRRIRKRV